ncbi:MAG: ABC transporter permease, partial [Chloroflexota bacterium]
MRELPLAFSYIKGRPLRSIMTILSIVIGVMIMFGLNGLAPSFKQLFVSSTQSMALTEVDLYVTRRDGGYFRQEYQQNVGSVKGVDSTASLIIRTVNLPQDEYTTADDRAISSIQVYGVDPSNTDETFDIVTSGGRRLRAGRLFKVDDQEVVLISEEFAEGLGIEVGESVRLPGASGWLTLEVIGLLDDPGLLLGSQQVFMPLTTAQDLLNAPNRVNIVMGRYAEGADAEAIDTVVKDMFGSGFELIPLGGGADVFAAILDYIDIIFTMFGLFALALAGLIMFNTFRTSVVERRRDIGMLRAVGARRKVVTRVFLYEGLLLAVFGTLTGMLLGFGFAQFASRGLNGVMEAFMGQPLGEPSFTIGTYAVAILFGLGIPVASVVIPARSASEVSPLEAMRPSTITQEASLKRNRLIVGWVSLVLGLAGLLSGVFPLMALG